MTALTPGAHGVLTYARAVSGVSLLGPVEVVRDDGRHLVPPGRTAELLCRLALDAGIVVTTERLIDELWGDRAGGQARNTVQTNVSRLRRVLGDPGAVVGSPAGYRLALAPADVDALAVVVDADRAAEARRAGSPAAVLAHATAALDRFRGEPFTGAGDGAWLLAHRVRFDELRLGLLELQMEARLDLGAAAGLVGPLEELVRLHPRREGLWRSLITALYRDGRQADALAAYTRLRTQLADELGLVPSAALARLEQQILHHDPSLDGRPDLVAGLTADPESGLAAGPGSGPDGGAAPRSGAPPLARLAPAPAPVVARGEPAAAPGNLPALVSALVGRDGELVAVEQLLVTGHALVTLVGPAGVGKTRLAIEIGRRADAPGGAWLARLETATDESGVLQAVAEALGVADASETALAERLRGDEVLLVLDNCEQVIAPVGQLVGRLLRATPATRVLATSQLPIGLEGEEVHPIEPLPVAAAAALFVARARRRRRTFGGAGDGPAEVEALCRALDGLPLAIELAAARAATLPVAEIARRLDDRFGLLHDPTGQRTGRHQALRTALAWSYDLLRPDDQRLLQLLATFPGGAPLAGVEHVAPALGLAGDAVIDGVGRLVDRSLVTVTIDGGEARYRLLDSVRAFALGQLDAAPAGPEGTVRSALDRVLAHQVGWYAELASAAAAGLRGPDQSRHLAVARHERANIVHALDWAAGHEPALALRIANGFGWAWFLLGDGPFGAERLHLARAAAEAVGAATSQERAHNRCLAAWLGASNDIARARADADAALALAVDPGADPTVASAVETPCRAALAFVLVQQGLPAEVLATLEPVLGRPPDPAQPWYEAAVWRLAAHAWLVLGDTARAADAGDRAERLLTGIGDDWALAHLANLRGVLAQTGGRHHEATNHLRSAAEASERLGFRAAQALHLVNLARSLELAGDGEAAADVYRHGIETALAARDLRLAALARSGLGRRLRTAGDRAGAAELVAEADAWFRRSGGGEGAVLAGALAAALDAEAGDPAAGERLAEMVERARREGAPDAELVALDALARHRAPTDPAAARDLLAAADEVVASRRVLVDGAERVDARAARAQLDS